MVMLLYVKLSGKMQTYFFVLPLTTTARHTTHDTVGCVGVGVGVLDIWLFVVDKLTILKFTILPNHVSVDILSSSLGSSSVNW